MLPVFIGYDSREPVAYHVLAHSILRRASIPVSTIPVALSQLGGIYTRARGPLESTEFSLTRFLVPYLSKYAGWAVFLDCDMLCLTDIAEVLTEVEAQPGKSLYVAPHNYTPRATTKFLGQPQTAYPRKNWSSFMVFNTAQCTQLTPDYVNTASGLDLHRFSWLPDEQIGYLDLQWNWLVGEYSYDPVSDTPWYAPLGDGTMLYKDPPKILHYTLGGPWFPETHECDHAVEWFAEREHLEAPCRL
jgi:lipopolysaccharide biosynthesis glycosyltransferase